MISVLQLSLCLAPAANTSFRLAISDRMLANCSPHGSCRHFAEPQLRENAETGKGLAIAS